MTRNQKRTIEGWRTKINKIIEQHQAIENEMEDTQDDDLDTIQEIGIALGSIDQHLEELLER